MSVYFLLQFESINMNRYHHLSIKYLFFVFTNFIFFIIKFKLNYHNNQETCLYVNQIRNDKLLQIKSACLIMHQH